MQAQKEAISYCADLRSFFWQKQQAADYELNLVHRYILLVLFQLNLK